MYDRILIPVDGSDEATHAARRGLELARTCDATVSVLHVVEQKSLRLTEAVEEKTRLREQGETVLEDIAELTSEFDQPVTRVLTEGEPAVQISDAASERNTDLIVIGRQGMTGLGKRLLGGVTEQVLRRSDVPVFVVPEGDPVSGTHSGYSRILVPTDGSDNTDAAIPHGAPMARHFDSTIHVLNVVDLQAAGGVFSAGGLETEFVQRLEARGREAVTEVADEISEVAPDVDVKTSVERTTSHGGVPVGVREYVEESNIDMVVMGTRGRSNLERQLFGSVASTVLRTVDVPILVVKPD
ncbi:MAG: universal stress protein [Halobacteriales archaeon]